MARFSHEFCPGIHCDPGNLRWMVGGHQHTSYRRRPFSGDQRYDKLLNFLSIATCLLSGLNKAAAVNAPIAPRFQVGHHRKGGRRVSMMSTWPSTNSGRASLKTIMPN